ncbi:MAG TPA: hypothetical protein VFA16_10425 [Mycobacterium sp.]|uniref:hypothetical protein n=1 Tax=Mycobacterium sp. TaxID=1785 RepID=UPI002D37A6D0|nr:hypothetical protein [Mycobacterium sp.]HZU47646.1 hypothetical protein [Mycobacterium sp.]
MAVAWIAPDGYPTSLALSIIDALYSINARYEGVVNVVNRYLRYRASQQGDPNTDGLIELFGTFEHVGGSDGWADIVDNHWRTSTRSGILKSEAVREEAHVLAKHGVWRVTDIDAAALEGRLEARVIDWAISAMFTAAYSLVEPYIAAAETTRVIHATSPWQ